MSQNTIIEKFSLKDHLFNKEKVTYLGELFYTADKKFKKDAFVARVMERLLKYELKERIVWIAQVLEEFLPKDYQKATTLIVKALPPPLDAKKTDDDFGDFILAPLGEYVVRNGLSTEHLPTSLTTLREITMRFSMEDAMRAFINTHTKEVMKTYSTWAKDAHYHVRRLVSESTRPLLPWSRRVTLTHLDTLPLLTLLHADTTRYVTRSVANHLNDIAKKHPHEVIAVLSVWKKEARQDGEELEWMTKHALRTLIKQGNKEALQLLGFRKEVGAQVERFSLVSTTAHIALPCTLSFSCTLTGKKDESLLIDYAIGFLKKNGEVKEKVFKLKKVSLKKGEQVALTKNHRLLADATTYRVYKGTHSLTLLVNGKRMGTKTFVIK
jgi:3-methyladenine DNA glycosylase AlkC